VTFPFESNPLFQQVDLFLVSICQFGMDVSAEDQVTETLRHDEEFSGNDLSRRANYCTVVRPIIRDQRNPNYCFPLDSDF
jgi:hypothetical protein